MLVRATGLSRAAANRAHILVGNGFRERVMVLNHGTHKIVFVGSYDYDRATQTVGDFRVTHGFVVDAVGNVVGDPVNLVTARDLTAAQ